MDAATMSDPKGAPMHGATQLLRDVLGELENAATRRPEPAPNPSHDLQPDPEAQAATATLGDIVDRVDERAFGVLLLLLALPCTLPFVYVLPQIVALPMLALAAQMAMGKRAPWFPQRFRRRRFEIAAFRSVIARSEKYLGWVERFARPRLRPVTGQGGMRFVGVILLIPIASILTPLPATNTVPGIGVAVVALGLIERDGALVVLGLLVGLVWVGLLLTLGLEAASLIRA